MALVEGWEQAGTWCCLIGVHGDILVGPELQGVLRPGVGLGLCSAGELGDKMVVIRAGLTGRDRTCPGGGAAVQKEHSRWGPHSQPGLLLRGNPCLVAQYHLSSAPVSCGPECPLSQLQ